jgi:hypothetical protein
MLVISNTQKKHQALTRIFRRMEEDRQVVGMLEHLQHLSTFSVGFLALFDQTFEFRG